MMSLFQSLSRAVMLGIVTLTHQAIAETQCSELSRSVAIDARTMVPGLSLIDATSTNDERQSEFTSLAVSGKAHRVSEVSR